MADFHKKEKFTYKDISNLILSRTEESLYLEFKRAEALSQDNKYEIAKDVCAFANSDGESLNNS